MDSAQASKNCRGSRSSSASATSGEPPPGRLDDGAIVGASYRGEELVGSTTFKLGPKPIVVPGVVGEGELEALAADRHSER